LIDNNDWELHFVGDGPERNNLIDLAIKLKIDSRVYFHGFSNDVIKFYETAKIFAFTSNSEGFPNVLGEAMSHGLATITYDFIAGASDLIINNHNGILIELNNQVSFRNKLVELINNEHLICKLGINAIECIKKYDINIIANRYLEMLLKDEKH
jgi:GalNAc-alpha-(1->4)-GalNAc-alpha-(1->3)-diNAcBac-PP-undecaprenol alpha-1,4-N-acetyl-D-galactosaminyltransferase